MSAFEGKCALHPDDVVYIYAWEGSILFAVSTSDHRFYSWTTQLFIDLFFPVKPFVLILSVFMSSLNGPNIRPWWTYSYSGYVRIYVLHYTISLKLYLLPSITVGYAFSQNMSWFIIFHGTMCFVSVYLLGGQEFLIYRHIHYVAKPTHSRSAWD